MKYLGFQGLHPTVTNKPTIAIFEDNSSECIRQKNTNNTYCRLRHFWSSIMVIETGTSNVCVSDQHPTNNSGWWFQPLCKILVSWDDYSQYTVWKNKKCSKPPTRLSSCQWVATCCNHSSTIVQLAHVSHRCSHSYASSICWSGSCWTGLVWTRSGP